MLHLSSQLMLMARGTTNESAAPSLRLTDSHYSMIWLAITRQMSK